MVGCIASRDKNTIIDNNRDLGSLTSGGANAFPAKDAAAGFGGGLDMSWAQSDPFH